MTNWPVLSAGICPFRSADFTQYRLRLYASRYRAAASSLPLNDGSRPAFIQDSQYSLASASRSVFFCSARTFRTASSRDGAGASSTCTAVPLRASRHQYRRAAHRYPWVRNPAQAMASAVPFPQTATATRYIASPPARSCGSFGRSEFPFSVAPQICKDVFRARRSLPARVPPHPPGAQSKAPFGIAPPAKSSLRLRAEEILHPDGLRTRWFRRLKGCRSDIIRRIIAEIEMLCLCRSRA